MKRRPIVAIIGGMCVVLCDQTNVLWLLLMTMTMTGSIIVIDIPLLLVYCDILYYYYVL